MNLIKHTACALYVSECGRVFGPRKERKFRCDKDGYLRLNTIFAGKHKAVKVHTLVAECFIGPVGSKTVNHKDGNKKNNVVANLELISSAENTSHAFKNGHVKYCKPIYGCYSLREASRATGINRAKLSRMHFELSKLPE